MTQEKQILQHLQKYGEITPLEALSLYGCFRLGARIWDLRREGHKIITSRTSVGKKTFATYRLIEEAA